MPPSLHSRVLARAAEIVGGVAALSDYLQVPQADLMRWIKGEEEPTRKSFLDAVDMLLEHDMGEFGPQKLQDKTPK
jgi:hypothetical protein